MSGTHDILAAERAAAAANKQSNQGIWQGQAEDTIKDTSSGLDTGRTAARDTLSGATSSDLHRGIGHQATSSGQSSQELHGREGRKHET